MKVSEICNLMLLGLMVVVIGACGKVEDTATEVKNHFEIKGHWLMTQSEHSSTIEKALESESMVLTFKDDKAAFAPTDSVKGRAVYALLSRCTAEVRPYRTEDNSLVFAPVNGCEEKRVTVQKLEDGSLKFPDPENGDITRTFRKISEETYNTLVKASDRRP